MIWLPLLVLGVAPSADDARVVTSIVAAALAEDRRVDVVTQQDLRQAVAVEAERQAVGCSAEGCLAEVAAAMGARFVVFGSIGTFDDELVLELSAFDAEAATSVGRSVVRGTSLKAVSALAEEKARAMRSQAIGAVAGTGRVRVLVLDFERRNAAPPEAARASSMSGWTMGAWAAGAGAGAALIVGISGDVVAVSAQNEADTEVEGELVPAKLATQKYGAADQAKVFAAAGYIGAGVLAVTAGVLYVVGAVAAE